MVAATACLPSLTASLGAGSLLHHSQWLMLQRASHLTLRMQKRRRTKGWANHNFPLFIRKGKVIPGIPLTQLIKNFLLKSHWLELQHLDSHPFLREKMGSFVFAFGVEKGDGKGIGGDK